jgi:hypothetical protein
MARYQLEGVTKKRHTSRTDRIDGSGYIDFRSQARDDAISCLRALKTVRRPRKGKDGLSSCGERLFSSLKSHKLKVRSKPAFKKMPAALEVVAATPKAIAPAGAIGFPIRKRSSDSHCLLSEKELRVIPYILQVYPVSGTGRVCTQRRCCPLVVNLLAFSAPGNYRISNIFTEILNMRSKNGTRALSCITLLLPSVSLLST